MSPEPGEARPRAYYPDGTEARPDHTATPGWDIGPERRISDGRTLARALGWFGIGLVVAVVMVALLRSDVTGSPGLGRGS